MSTAGSLAPGSLPSTQSHLMIVCWMNQILEIRGPPRSLPSPTHAPIICPPYKAVTSIEGDYASRKVWYKWSSQQTDVCFFGSSLRSPSFHVLCLLRILQQKLNFADKFPRAFPKTCSFWEKMSLLTSQPQESMRYSSQYRGLGSALGLVEAPLHLAGRGAAAGTTGGSLSIQAMLQGGARAGFPFHTEAMSPALWMKSRLLSMSLQA